MKIIHSNKENKPELPFKLMVSFKEVFSFYQKYTEEDHPYRDSAIKVTTYLQKYPELIEGFEDFSLLNKYEEQIELMLEGLFPEALTLNEIKAVSIPFDFTVFKFTQRFENIIANAGDNFELTLRNFEENEIYIHACTMILGMYYKRPIDLRRPFFFDIPNKQTGITNHYRVAFNADFAKFEKTDKAPDLTDDDIKLLLDNYGNIEVWKEKFPPDSYVFKGFGIMNLFDVTADETLSSLKANLLRRDDNLIKDVQENLREFYGIKDLMVGFSLFDRSKGSQWSTMVKKTESLIMTEECEVECGAFFCQGVNEHVFNHEEIMAISDVDHYGKMTEENGFYKSMKKRGIGSIILVPLQGENNFFALLEIASPRAYELNSVNQNKLKDIIPVFKAAVQRASEDHQNILEATIQEHYTAIHPSVKWRFYEAAEQYFRKVQSGEESPVIDEIVFNDVYPLFGQSDIKGSSDARNKSIREDLIEQLNLAIDVLAEACKEEKMPIYDELMFRVKEYLTTVENGLKAGDEIGIVDFLKREIYPVFKHVRGISEDLNVLVSKYMDQIDPHLQVIYKRRKAYEQSVNLLNTKLSLYLDRKQEEAQQMFPHYYERYKTDGVEYNMYIGDSLVNDRRYDNLYLYNLRLWQLQIMCELENVAHQLKNDMPHELDVASLILVHSNSMAIKFRMDEKQFDVDGAYNIRYEIIKKRIDKAFIKGTKERLTTPGKIAIVYSQEKDALEYMKYIKYLQSKNLLGKVEKLILEDLQGVSGLKALRVEVVYQNDFNEKETITFDQLMQEIKA